MFLPFLLALLPIPHHVPAPQAAYPQVADGGTNAGDQERAEQKRFPDADEFRDAADVWQLRLYVAGRSAKSMAAFSNLKKICEEHLAGRYNIEVVDLLEHPQLAAGDQIVAIPTLVRKLPEPLRKIVGDLRNTEKTLVGLQLRPLVKGDV